MPRADAVVQYHFIILTDEKMLPFNHLFLGIFCLWILTSFKSSFMEKKCLYVKKIALCTNLLTILHFYKCEISIQSFEEIGSILNSWGRQGHSLALWLDRETSTFWATFQAGWTGRQSSFWNTQGNKNDTKKRKNVWVCRILIVFYFKIKASFKLF